MSGWDQKAQDRFWSRVRESGDAADCWLWTGPLNRGGYGQIMWEGRRAAQVHRVAWVILRGEIPDGLHVDHLCRRRECVNPYHFDLVTLAVNTQRGDAPSIQLHRQGVCKQGHPVVSDNVIRVPRGHKCRTCQKARDRARRAERRVAA